MIRFFRFFVVLAVLFMSPVVTFAAKKCPSCGKVYEDAAYNFCPDHIPAPKLVPIKPPPREVSSFKESVTGMEFVSVPGGCFQMGDSFGDGDRDEKPVHKVCLSDFSIGKYVQMAT